LINTNTIPKPPRHFIAKTSEYLSPSIPTIGKTVIIKKLNTILAKESIVARFSLGIILFI
jgi:hypothetical protein